MESLDTLLDEEVFFGPITQRELIITWRRRRQERLERERAESLKNGDNCPQTLCSVSEPDAMKMSPQSEEIEMQAEPAHDVRLLDVTPNPYELAEQSLDDLRDGGNIASPKGEKVAEDDNNCVESELKGAASNGEISITGSLSKIKDEPVFDPLESVRIMKDNEDSISENSEKLAEQSLDNLRDGGNIASPEEGKGAEDDNNCVEGESKGAASDAEISINGSLSKIKDEPVFGSMVLCNKNDPQESVWIIKDDKDTIFENSENLAEQSLDNLRDGGNIASPEEGKGAEDDNNCVEGESKGAASDAEISINGSLSKIKDEPVFGSMVVCNKNDPQESVWIIKDDEDAIFENSEKLAEQCLDNPPDGGNIASPKEEKGAADDNNCVESELKGAAFNGEISMNGSLSKIKDEPVFDSMVVCNKNGPLESVWIIKDDEDSIFENSETLAEQSLDNPPDGGNIASPKEEKGAADDNNCVESELKGAAFNGEISMNGSLSKIKDEPVFDSMVVCNKNDPLESVWIMKDNEDSISESSENYQDALGGHEDNDGVPSQKLLATDGIPTHPVPVMDKQNGPPSPSDSPTIKSESPLVKITETETPESNPVVPAHTASKSNIPKRSILKPSSLNVDLSTLNTSWVKRINMSKIPKPKRPVYVQPLEK